MLERGIRAWLPSAAGAELKLTVLAPLGWTSVMGLLLLALTAAGSAWLAVRLRRTPAQITGTWDCGYAAPTARMQYTSSSFAEMLVGLFGWALRPKTRLAPVEGLFPQSASFSSDVQDVVLDEVVLPASAEPPQGWFGSVGCNKAACRRICCISWRRCWFFCSGLCFGLERAGRTFSRDPSQAASCQAVRT